jgi:uncharacterized membrane protein YfhO
MKIRNNTENILLPAKVFTGGVLVYLLAVLPFLIDRKGLFFYYGDYNVQQVPFLIFAHRAVRSGRLLWNPLVDLGGNMTGTFAFYLWGSPFFWLTIPFPESWLPYMTPFLMALKFGTAAAASFMWIRTQTRSDKAAVLGAYLYAFSGFQACNIVFQHFHDVTAFFPLYLLAFDRFVTGSRKAWDREFPDLCAQESGSRRRGAEGLLGFTLMTALMSVINYYFFFGQVLFFVLYYIVRWGIRRARGSGVKALAVEILRILAAGAAGLLLSAFFLVQSIAGIMGNTRVSRVVNGYDLLVYPDSVTSLAILKSFFMVPDLIARGTLFTNDNIRNGSLAFYLPCFAMAGVFAYWMLRRRSWKKTLVTVLAVMAFVPVLNASFSAFNSNFYTRWFYMPVLLCACMTAEVLEEEDSTAFTRGSLLSLACTALFILFCFLPVEDGGKWSFTAVCENRNLLTREIIATLFGSAVLLVILFVKRRCGNLFTAKTAAAAEIPEGGRPEIPAKGASFTAAGILKPGTLCLALTIVCCITSTMTVLKNGSSLISYTGFQKWKRQMLCSRPVLAPPASSESSPASSEPFRAAAAESDPEEETGQGEDTGSPAIEDMPLTDNGMDGPVPGVDAPFARVETDSTSTNYEMVWGYPTMHCFESTVHPSIFKWYRGIGMIRTVESTLPFERIGARALMSVRYYLENTLVKPDNSYTDQDGIDGYSLINDRNGYNVYETENYIPMGFSFDSYMTEENYDLLKNGTVSDRVLVKDIILSEEMAEKYGDLMTEDTDTAPGQMSYRDFTDYCADRAASACTEFAFDRNGFHAEAQMEKDNLLLFSVPYDRGFTALIDNQPARVECADYGLTAIFVPAGTHNIEVTYMPPGLVPAAIVSLVTAAALLVFGVLTRRRQKLQ